MAKSRQFFSHRSFLFLLLELNISWSSGTSFSHIYYWNSIWIGKKVKNFLQARIWVDLEDNQRSWERRNGPCFRIHMTRYCQKAEKLCFQNLRSRLGLLGHVWSPKKRCWAWQMGQGSAAIPSDLQQKLAKSEVFQMTPFRHLQPSLNWLAQITIAFALYGSITYCPPLFTLL